jgi:hypothetical protein
MAKIEDKHESGSEFWSLIDSCDDV